MGRSSNRSTTMAMGRGNRHDGRLSNLPDDILLAVLDRLNARDAARTSVLSRRWIRLPAMLSRLRVSVQDFLPHKGPVFSTDEVARSNAAVVEATRSILARREEDSAINTTTIRLLSLAFFLKDGDHVSIGRAVARAMATREVEVAEFTVVTEKDAAQCDDDDIACYGRQFVSFFDACPDSFRGLTRLHLENLRFGGEPAIANVLAVCERLKDLRLFNCDAGDVTTLQVDHAQLTDLGVVDCLFSTVVLNWVPRLARLAYEGWNYYHYPLTVGYAPLLEAVDLSNVGLSSHERVELSKFFRGTTSVRDLKLGFKSERIWVQPERLTKSRLASVFGQLRFLNLDDIPEGYDLTWTLFILRAAPLLKELYMTVWDHRCKMVTDAEKRRELSFSEDKGAAQWEESSDDGFRHDGLATLVMFGFQYEEYMVGYVRRVMEVAVNMKDVFLYDGLACGTCPRKRVKFPWTKRRRSWVKKRITHGFDSFPMIHFRTAGGIRADHLTKQKYP